MLKKLVGVLDETEVECLRLHAWFDMRFEIASADDTTATRFVRSAREGGCRC